MRRSRLHHGRRPPSARLRRLYTHQHDVFRHPPVGPGASVLPHGGGNSPRRPSRDPARAGSQGPAVSERSCPGAVVEVPRRQARSISVRLPLAETRAHRNATLSNGRSPPPPAIQSNIRHCALDDLNLNTRACRNRHHNGMKCCGAYRRRDRASTRWSGFRLVSRAR